MGIIRDRLLFLSNHHLSVQGAKLQYHQKVNKELDLFWGERPIEMTIAVSSINLEFSEIDIQEPVLDT